VAKEVFLKSDVQDESHVKVERRTFCRQISRLALIGLVALISVGSALAQEEEKPKVPGLDKIIEANQHLMFTGKVKAVDLNRNTLSVSSIEGSDTEIFPIKSSTHVLTSDGFRKKIDVLSPGTQIIVYYDQRADRRSITHIDLYTSETKKKEPHS
jgi:hypothetical protein